MRHSAHAGAASQRWLARVVLALGLLLLAGCDRSAPSPVMPAYAPAPLDPIVRELSFGIHPLHNPARLLALYGPIIDEVNRTLPDIRLHLVTSRDYADYERKLREGVFDIAMPNPYQTVQARPAYRIFGKVADDSDFHGLILRRKGSALREPDDLRHRRFSCPSRTAVAACMLPLLYLHDRGLDVARELDVREVGSQESSIMNVATGMVDAGATWPPPWRAFKRTHPALAAQLEVAWRTDTLPNNGLVARTDLDPGLVQRVAVALYGMSEREAGRRLLSAAEIRGFEPADDARYAPVERMLERYSRVIGPLPQ